MGNALATRTQADLMEQVIVNGDLSQLSPAHRLEYYRNVCESVGLNPLTKPFSYIRLNGKLTLYALKDATDQLRKIHGISVRIVNQQQLGDLYTVTVEATDRTGRIDSDLGITTTKGKGGDDLANAMMKAVTKAKRRVTLSLAGLGWLDETEIESIPAQAVQRVVVADTGEIVEPAATVPTVTPETPNGNGNGNGNGHKDEAPELISKIQLKKLHAVGGDFYGDEWDAKRPELVNGVTKGRATSASDLTRAQADKLIDGIQKRINERQAAAVKDADPADNPFAPTPIDVGDENSKFEGKSDAMIDWAKLPEIPF